MQLCSVYIVKTSANHYVCNMKAFTGHSFNIYNSAGNLTGITFIEALYSIIIITISKNTQSKPKL